MQDTVFKIVDILHLEAIGRIFPADMRLEGEHACFTEGTGIPPLDIDTVGLLSDDRMPQITVEVEILQPFSLISRFMAKYSSSKVVSGVTKAAISR